MDGMKKIVIRLLLVIAFSGTVFWLTQELTGLYMVDRYSRKIEQDLLSLSRMVEYENVLATDTLSGQSMYEKFVNGTLRLSEDFVLKYDVSVSSLGIHQNNALDTKGYAGSINESNPIKVYYLDAEGRKVFVDSYINCPNRGTKLFVELTGNVYVPVLSNFKRTSDTYSQDNYRQLVKVTKRTSVIGSNFYKGK